MKKHKSGSALYRAAFSAQSDYLDELDDLFPWVEPAEGDGDSESKKGHDPKSDNMEVDGVKVEGSKSDAVKSSPMQLEW